MMYDILLEVLTLQHGINCCCNQFFININYSDSESFFLY